jgi:hypothetical protein
MEKYFLITGSAIILILGTIHLIYTFFTDKFNTRNLSTQQMMAVDSPVLTRKTTIWKAWIGFNASHSIGAMFIGIINIIIAIENFSLFQESASLLILDNCTIIFFAFLAVRYWFIIPMIGIFITLACFLIATLLIIL